MCYYKQSSVSLIKCILWILLNVNSKVLGGHSKYQGPSFIHEPPNKEIFYNNTGAVIPCVANGTPRPEVTWTTGDNITVTPVSGLRHIRPDGSLAFSPFRKEDYRSDVHSAVYRCSASNSAGSIVSRDVNVRGDVFVLSEQLKQRSLYKIILLFLSIISGLF